MRKFNYVLFFLLVFTQLNAQNLCRLTLSVDMSGVEVSSEGVYVNGNFFNGRDEPLKKESGQIWTLVARFSKGDSLFYNFKNGTKNLEPMIDGDCISKSKAGKRFLVVPQKDTAFAEVACFGACISCDKLVSVTEDLKEKYQIVASPNPFFESTTISWTSTKEELLNVKLFNLTGQLLKTFPTANNNQFVLNREGLMKGFYFLVFQDEKGNVGTLKLIGQ